MIVNKHRNERAEAKCNLLIDQEILVIATGIMHVPLPLPVHVLCLSVCNTSTVQRAVGSHTSHCFHWLNQASSHRADIDQI